MGSSPAQMKSTAQKSNLRTVIFTSESKAYPFIIAPPSLSRALSSLKFRQLYHGGPSSAPRDPALHHETQPLKQIAVDYTPKACDHCAESNSIALAYDHRGGARWRTTTRFQYGTFSALIKCPGGNTSGLNFNLYLSSLEGDKSQDEIDFEFLGKDKTIVQTNYYTEGTGNREQIHDLGFDFSDGFHEYVMKWDREYIEWLIDGKLVRREDRRPGESFPDKPMFLYASVWDASYIDNARWTGPYVGSDVPYVCLYKEIHVPARTAVE